MSRVVFLLEEQSMKRFLDGFLPRIAPGLSFLCVPHEGKRDLERSIPRKLRAWKEPGVRFVVLRDNDGGDCLRLKRRLRDLCRKAGRADTIVRIPCQELEAWYLGDLGALAKGYGIPDLLEEAGRSKFRDPDAVVAPGALLEGRIPGFQKSSGARLLSELLDPEVNRSASFRAFVESVRRLASERA
jgi:hypothetical protein